MYAIINIGGKQERVSVGDTVRVEYLGEESGTPVDLESVLVVDGDDVRVMPDDLKEIKVAGVVVGEELGEKIRGFTYKPKTRSRKRYGHRQMYSLVKIESIVGPGIDASDGRDGDAGSVDSAASAVTVVDGD